MERNQPETNNPPFNLDTSQSDDSDASDQLSTIQEESSHLEEDLDASDGLSTISEVPSNLEDDSDDSLGLTDLFGDV